MSKNANAPSQPAPTSTPERPAATTSAPQPSPGLMALANVSPSGTEYKSYRPVSATGSKAS